MPYQADPALAAFVQSLPKTETHLHLDGAIPLELLREAFPGKYEETPPMWADDFRYASFDQFMELFDHYIAAYFSSPERYYTCARKVLARCVSQNCRYVETSIHLPGVLHTGAPLVETLQAIRAARPEGLELRLFVGLPHNGWTSELRPLIEEAMASDLVDGIDLHAQEYLPMEPWTEKLWGEARAQGKFTKAHAGEFMPASFVSWCLDHLEVTRIEHGVRSIEDPALVARLAAEGVALDVCPISNVKLAVEGIPDMASHPIRPLFDAGVKVTVNSDDPFMFGNTLSEDYYALYQELHFTKKELVQLARNGFDIALWEGEGRTAAYAELERIEAGLEAETAALG
ncbi:MAG: adenosine deaminase family protein [Opitutales bacterium]